MTRRRRKRLFHPESGAVYKGWRAGVADSTATDGVGPNYDTVWIDRYDHTVWVVDFTVNPYTVTETTGNGIDGWVLNDGWFIYLDKTDENPDAITRSVTLSNDQGLLTPRFRNIPTSVSGVATLQAEDGRLIHTIP